MVQSRRTAEDALTGWIDADEFSCLGGKASLHRGELDVAFLGDLNGLRAAQDGLEHVRRFVAGPLARGAEFASLALVYSRDGLRSEGDFHVGLWRQLAALRALDTRSAGEPPLGVSSSAEDPNFALVLAGEAFFVVGLNPWASRVSRRFKWPAMVFNSHRQFDRLRASGTYGRMQRTIRRRELDLQGSLNPMLAEFGESSEARQYSGMPVPSDWRCPLS